MSNSRGRVIDMGYTLVEFGKVLQGNFSAADSPYRAEKIANDHWRVTAEPTLSITIRLSEKPPRQLGLLNLPVLAVSFTTESGDSDDELAFFDKFFKYFHKGGG